MSSVELSAVRKRFGATEVVRDVSLTVADGEVMALLGPSGSGKTTLLRLIAGFETADGGRILFGDSDVTTRSALERRCGMVFQHYALFPHLSVGENVGYGLVSSLRGEERRERVAEVLRLVDLAGFEGRAVTELSGGQQQRVALARAIAPRPKVLLLDEPLSNLDPSLRERTRRELRDLVRAIGITTLLVTHEQEEAFDFADRIALLHRGVLEQVGTPEVLYGAPATPFVASFVGRTSHLPGRVVGSEGEGVRIEAAGTTWLATGKGLTGEVDLLLRPEAARIVPDEGLSATVRRRRFAGAVAFFEVALPGELLLEVAGSSSAARPGDVVRVAPTGIGAHAFPRGT